MMSNKQQHKREIIKNILIIVTCLLIVAAIIVPLPYYIEVPGSAENVRDFVSVDGKRNKNAGSFMLTTVGIRQGTAATLLAASVQPFHEIVSKEELMGESTNDEYNRLTEYQMTASENLAKKVALDLAELPYEFDYKGVYVMNVAQSSNFKGKLEVGDVVYQIDDKKFESSQEFMTYIQKRKADDEVTIKFTREGKDKSASGKLIMLEETKKPGIGITLVEHSELTTEQDVKIQTENIGGPSAGLMFTLELYDLLAGTDLRQGRDIAGTGTINSDGTVGSIGGIDKKIVAADLEGATIFFAPDEELSPDLLEEFPELKDEPSNYDVALEAAKKINTKMKIVPVKTVHDAINYLKKATK